MNRLFLYFFFITAFLALVMMAAYLLLVAGAKYNGESLSPSAVYYRARNSQPQIPVNPRNIDSGLTPPTEFDRINMENQQVPQVTPNTDSNNMSSTGVNFQNLQTVPVNGSNGR